MCPIIESLCDRQCACVCVSVPFCAIFRTAVAGGRYAYCEITGAHRAYESCEFIELDPIGHLKTKRI